LRQVRSPGGEVGIVFAYNSDMEMVEGEEK
jgi:hypothetical protein